MFEYSPLDGAVAQAVGESKGLRSWNNVRTVLFSETFSFKVEKAKWGCFGNESEWGSSVKQEGISEQAGWSVDTGVPAQSKAVLM